MTKRRFNVIEWMKMEHYAVTLRYHFDRIWHEDETNIDPFDMEETFIVCKNNGKYYRIEIDDTDYDDVMLDFDTCYVELRDELEEYIEYELESLVSFYGEGAKTFNEKVERKIEKL